MTFFGPDLRNGLPIGLGSVAGFGIAPQFSPASLFTGGVNGAWYDPSDSTTLFTDRAGTTPCGTPGGGSVVPVGLMLDKSQNGVGTNGAYRYNLLTYTEQFDNAAWVKDGSTAANTTATTDPLGGNTADVLTATLALYAYTYQPTPVSTITATFSCYVKAATASVFWLYYEQGAINGLAYFQTDLTTQVVAGSSQTPSNLTITSVGNGWFRISAQWSTVAGSRNFGVGISDAKGSSAITIGRAGYIWGAQVASAAAPTAYQRIDANWYSAVPGNHAIAANDTTARPELRARVNLLERSEEFENAYWTSSQGTIAANAGVAPNGTTTADLLTPTSTGTFRQRYRVFAASAISYSLSVYAKASGKTGLMFTDFPGTIAGAQFDLSAGTVTSTASGYTATIQAVGDGWYRCVMTATPTAGATRYAGICVTDNGGTTTGTLDGTNGILIWGAQLTATNEFPANTYQRISDANTYDAVGFPRYLACNGTSSAMSTPANLNLSSTDKATVFAGVRKLSDAIQVYTELSADYNVNNGTFLLWSNSSPNALYFDSKGTIIRSAQDPATAAAPASFVLTGQGNISAPSVTLRKNGTQVVSNTNSQGTGNYGSYPLFIGARNNNTFFITGNLYSLIVVGSAVSAGQISATEQWVAGKTGITI